MADSVHWNTSLSYSCCAFIHLGQVSQVLSHDNGYSAIVLDSSGRRIVSGMLMLSGQNAVSQPINRSSDAFDVSNGHTVSAAKSTAVFIHGEQDISNVSSWNKDCRVQFTTPVKVFLLKMDAQLAGCITKTLNVSSKFAHSFINYARYCVRKRAFVPAHNAYFNVDTMSALDSCSDISCSQVTAPLVVPSEETTQNAITVHQTVMVVMTAPRRLEIDYQWCYRLCELVVKRLELDDAMNWLSTLGGAYSALGDYFVYHAECAANISLKQLRIALEMGSPPVVIRCHLYFALSLLQTGRLHAAKRLIWLQYQEVLRLPVRDTQLVAICQSLWSRLRYLRRKRCELPTIKFVEKSQS